MKRAWFQRIRGGKWWTLSHGGIHVSPPYLIFPSFLVLSNYHFNVCWVVEEIMAGSGVWQDCQSLPTRTLHQQVDLTLASKNDHHYHSSWLPILTAMPLSPFPVHPHAGMVFCSLSRTGIFFVWSHAARRGKQFGCHSHSCRVVSSVFSIQIPEVWCKFPSRTGWESVFSSPVRPV